MFSVILLLLCASTCNAQSLDVQLSIGSKLAQHTCSHTFDITECKQLNFSTEKAWLSRDTISVTIDMLKSTERLVAQASIVRETGDGKRELLAEPIMMLVWDTEGVITIDEESSTNPSESTYLSLRVTAHK